MSHLRRVMVIGAGICLSVTAVGCAKAPPPPVKNPPAAVAPADLAPAPAPAPAPAVAKPAAPEQAAAAKPAPAAAESAPAKGSGKEPMPADAKPAAAPSAATAAKPAGTPETPAAVAQPTLADLRARLAAATDENGRVDAIDAIADLGQNARPALDELVKYCDHEEIRTRWHAARAVGMIGEDAIAALPVLVRMLGDTDPIAATQAAAAIGHIRADDHRAADALPAAAAAAYDEAKRALIQATVHPDARVRRASLRAIGILRPPVDVLGPLFAKQLADADPSVVLPAVRSLADIGGPAVPLLVDALKHPKSRYWAAIALAEIGPEAAPAVDVLTEQLSSADVHECVQAMIALGAIGKRAAPAVDDLVRELESREPARRLGAAFALGRIGDPAADEPLARVTGGDPFMESVLLWARAKINPADEPLRDKAVLALVRGLASEVPGVRSGSVSALSDLAPRLDAPAAEKVAERFVDLLADRSDEPRTQAATALVRLGKRGVAPLVAALDDEKRRLLALELLAAIGADAEPALGRLANLLADPDPAVSGDAAMVLAAIGPPAARTVPALQAMLASPADEERRRYAAAYALGRIGAEAEPALGALRELTSSKDEMLATVATWATLRIGPTDAAAAEAAVPLLRRALRNDVEMVRLEAAAALGELGHAALGAVPLLELVSEDDASRVVRAVAAEALPKIRGR
jgi:HEAT repeat protein